MKNVFVDTNVIIDLLLERKPHSDSIASLFELADEKQVKLFASAMSFNNIYYILRKITGHKNTILLLSKLSPLINTLPLTKDIIDLAFTSDNKDFEDAIQYLTALQYKKIDAIVTRYIKGFPKSEIPLFTPSEIFKIL